MAYVCEGCLRSFTSWGFKQHRLKTSNSACSAPSNVENNSEPNFSDPAESDESETDSELEELTAHVLSDFDPDSAPISFEGDYFGSNYTTQDLGQMDVEEADEEWEWGEGSASAEDGIEEEADFDEDSLNALLEGMWEPERVVDVDMQEEPSPSTGTQIPVRNTRTATESHVHIEDCLRHKPFIVKFGGHAGRPISDTKVDDSNTRYERALGNDKFLWHPFRSRLDWEVARWGKLRGPGSNALNELLQIPGLAEKLDLSFKTTHELNKIIDGQLPGRPPFHRHEVVVAGESFEFFYRNILDCIRALWGDRDLTPYLIMCPERHYTDQTKDIQLFHSMHTGKWWWATQKEIEKTNPGATIIPLIISTDKTQLTVFGNKTAYPVYITIGNIPKEIRRKSSRGSYILLGYLPTSNLSHITNKTGRRRALANLFHACMKHIMAPIREPGINGMLVVDGNGVARRGHPIMAVYVTDYPEQCLASTAKYGRCAALCGVVKENSGDDQTDFPFLDFASALEVFEMISEGPTVFRRACKDAGMKPIPEPFWKDLPYVNIFQSITPDILHQLYQGLIKHLLSWLIKIAGAAEIDARFRRFPPNHNIRLFMRGVSMLSRVTGKEHEQISHCLLGIVIDLHLPNGASSERLSAAVRGMLNFVYLAQYPLHTTETLSLLRQSLTLFHDHKDVFVDTGIVSTFKIPKLHACQHFARHFENFGTADNFNSEYTDGVAEECGENA
ncbi:hypothetical protein VNI00_016226 [Paramarasmius palmivorus]|uniref:Uncharacterized protein n=1 Tax=Paramarasmius palmivorus TaxID=297713 RepID=A0AAW0BEL1_9AGAR